MLSDLWNVRVGDVLELGESILGVVLAATEDGEWIPVRYVSSRRRLELVGQTDLAHVDEVQAVFSFAHN